MPLKNGKGSNDFDMKRALITGITGQDGSYLAELLLSKGYEVHGIKRRASLFNTERVDHLYQDPHEAHRNFILHYGDLTDSMSVLRIVQEVAPHEVYNLGAQSHVQVSFESPEYTANADAIGALRILEAIRLLGMKEARFYQASTSEMFGNSAPPQNENTPFQPRSPYGAAKLYAYWMTINYRQAYGMFACNGILFNHESPRRGETFVTRKVSRAAARIKLGLQDKLFLGNLYAKRDWGHARDYVEAMYKILQHEEPDDYVVATGEQHSVKELCELAFQGVGVTIEWRGRGLEEEGVDVATGKSVIGLDRQYIRPTEVDSLWGDASKIKQKLRWTAKTSFEETIKEMVANDLVEAEKEQHLKNGGFAIRKGV